MVDLKGVYKVRAKGQTYYYAWRGKGAPRLKGKPGSPEFLSDLREAQANRKGGDRTKMSGLCAMFRASDAWNGRGPKPISAKTKASWTTWLDRIQTEFGDLRIEQFDRPTIRPIITKWRDRYAKTPRAADMAIQVLSRLLSFGMAEGKLMHNVCKGVESIYEVDRSGFIWTEDDLLKLEPHASAEVMQAARLGALTGLRQADLLKLCWWHIKANSIEIPTGKSGRRKTTLVPLYGELREFLATLPKRATTVLVTTKGEPWKSGFGSSWGDAVRAAGIGLHFHDLRGTAATRFYLGGLSIREIAEVMTWSEDQVEALINRYVKRDELLKDRIRRLDENTLRTDTAKPSAKPPPQKPRRPRQGGGI
jgi:integrase